MSDRRSHKKTVAQSKHYADRYANNAGPTAGADGL